MSEALYKVRIFIKGRDGEHIAKLIERSFPDTAGEVGNRYAEVYLLGSEVNSLATLLKTDTPMHFVIKSVMNSGTVVAFGKESNGDYRSSSETHGMAAGLFGGKR